MRVAFLTHEPFFPPSGGGSAEAVYLVREFVERGHVVHLFCPDFPDRESVAQEFRIQITPFTRWKMGRYVRWRNLRYLAYPSALARLIQETIAQKRATNPAFAFDLLFAQHTISAVAAGRLRNTLQTPILLNFLDYLTGFMETWPGWIMPKPVVRQLTQFELSLPRRFSADGILTVSKPLAERFQSTGYPHDRITPILYGYDARNFCPSSQPKEGPPVVVMHGSFDQHHLGQIAHETVARVAAARPDVTFRWVGRETAVLQKFIQRIRRLNPAPQIELSGFLPYERVAEQIQNATVGLVPYEASSGTHCAFVAKAVEYLGCGLPVASTPLAGLQGYFGSELAVRFSPTFDGAGLAAAVLAWLETPTEERRRLGLAASARVARELDWSALTRNAVDAAESVIVRAARERPFRSTPSD